MHPHFGMVTIATLTLGIAGCATQSPRPLADDHPANPNAVTAPFGPRSQTLAINANPLQQPEEPSEPMDTDTESSPESADPDAHDHQHHHDGDASHIAPAKPADPHAGHKHGEKP